MQGVRSLTAKTAAKTATLQNRAMTSLEPAIREFSGANLPVGEKEKKPAQCGPTLSKTPKAWATREDLRVTLSPKDFDDNKELLTELPTRGCPSE